MDEMFPFLNNLGAWNWLILAALLFAVEILVPGVFLIWFGLAALIVGTSALVVGISWQVQLVLFSGLSVASVIISKRYLRRDDDQSDKPLLNQRAEQYIGRSFVLSKSIENGRGGVKIADSIWQVEGEDCAEGTLVKIVGAEGTILKVEPA